MFKIIEKKQLSEMIYSLKVEAPEIARNRKAGQFVLFQLDLDYAERVPLTIADANAEEGWIQLVFQPIGASTYKLSKLNVGDELAAVIVTDVSSDVADTARNPEIASEVHV